MLYTFYMPSTLGTADIVARGLEGDLVRRVRADMAFRGQSLREWVTLAFRARLGRSFEEQATEGGVQGGTYIGEETKNPEWGQHASHPKRDRTPAGKSAEAGNRSGRRGSGDSEKDDSDDGVRFDIEQAVKSSHDSKSCRVYRCGACAADGVKDANRGLK